MKYHRLNVEQERQGGEISIFLDDTEIRGVTKCAVNMQIFETPTVTMEIRLSGVRTNLQSAQVEGGGGNGSATV